MLGENANVLDGFEAGANDYLTKPFEMLEVKARVKSLLKAKAYSDAAKEQIAIDEGALTLVARAVELQRLRTQHRYLLSERDEEFSHYGIVGRSRWNHRSTGDGMG